MDKTMTPLQKDSKTIDKKINAIAIVFGLIAMYQIYKEFDLIHFMITRSLDEWELSLVLYFLPILFLPILFLFWKRNKVGWIGMCSFFVYQLVSALVLFFQTLGWDKEDDLTNENLAEDLQLTHQELERLMQQPNPIVYLIITAVFGIALWIICKEDFRNEFQVNIRNGLITIGVATIITLTIVCLFQ